MQGKRIDYKFEELKAKAQGSKKYSMDTTDVQKIAKGAAIAAAGAALVFISNMAGMDWGQWTPIVTAIAAVIANSIRKWMAENQG